MTRLLYKLPLSLLLLVAVCQCGYGAWPYDAVCEITNTTPEQNGWPGGSATYVGTDGQRGLVISCGHIFENGGRQAVVNFPATHKGFRGTVVGVDQDHDLSAIEFVGDPGVESVGVNPNVTEADGPFTCVGFPYYAKSEPHFSQGQFAGTKDDGRILVRCEVHSGYSGGALFDNRGELSGVVCGMTGPTREQMDTAYAPTGQAFQRFVSRWLVLDQHKQCYGGSCPSCGGGGSYCPTCPSRPQRQQPREWTPTVGDPGTPTFHPTNPTQPPSTGGDGYTPGVSCPCGDIDAKIKKEVGDQIAALPKPKDGRDGVDGKDGKDGAPGKDGVSPTLDIDALATAVAGKIKLPTPQTPTTPKAEQHVVIVADHSASYWPRIADAVKRTQDTYQGVEVTTPPPDYRGNLPEAAVYENSIPVRHEVGQYDVEDLLSRLARGDSI